MSVRVWFSLFRCVVGVLLLCSCFHSDVGVGVGVGVSAQCTFSGGVVSGSITDLATAKPLVLFISQVFVPGSVGVTVADLICQNEASAAVTNPYISGNSGLFRAVLSTETVGAITRFQTGVPIVNSNGACLALSNSNTPASGGLWSGLDLSGKILTSTQAVPSTVTTAYTGTAVNGLPVLGATCNSFTGSGSGEFGSTSQVGLARWSTNGAIDCGSLLGLYCLMSVQPGGGVRGDPQFLGFQGQSFQFHGFPDAVFNLLSSPSFELNSRFIFLDGTQAGSCKYNDTECWTHPGTYIQQVGIKFRKHKIKIVAGPHATGLHVWIDVNAFHATSTAVRLGNDSEHDMLTLMHTRHSTVTIITQRFAITLHNSDMFLNLDVSLLDMQLLRAGAKRHSINEPQICQPQQQQQQQQQQTLKTPKRQHHDVELVLQQLYPVSADLHGLLGQTWRNAQICGKLWIGHATDYMVLHNFNHSDSDSDSDSDSNSDSDSDSAHQAVHVHDDLLFSTNHAFSLFKPQHE